MQQAGAAARKAQDEERLFDHDIGDFRMTQAIVRNCLHSSQIVMDIGERAGAAIGIEACFFFESFEQFDEPDTKIGAEVVRHRIGIEQRVRVGKRSRHSRSP
jgi:hypothetical protein